METTAKHKMGDVRDDGMIFLQYKYNRKNPEYWVTPEQYDKYINNTLIRIKLYKERNKQKVNEYHKCYREKNKEKQSDYFSKYYNKDKKNSINRVLKWAKENPEKHNEIIAKRRSQKKHGIISLTKDQRKIMRCFYRQADRLEKRFALQFHVDHIIPLSKGGLHIPSNLQVLPARLNLQKNSRNSLRWEELQLI
jgi:hypothetical protein